MNKNEKITNLLVLAILVGLFINKKTYEAPLLLLAITAVCYYAYVIFFNRVLLYEPLFTDNAVIYEQRLIIVVFLLYFVYHLFFLYWHQEDLNYLDKPYKTVLFTLVFCYLCRFTINFKWLLIGIMISSIVAGVIAGYQYFYLGYSRAFLSVMAIQFGNMGMTVGLFGALIAVYFFSQKQWLFFVMALLAVLFGIGASILSGSRGGWLALPFFVFYLIWIYREKSTIKILLPIFTAAVILTMGMWSLPQVKTRVYQAKNDIISYQNDEKNTSIGYRLELWKSAIYAWQDKPVLGWGEKGVKQAVQKQADEDLIIKSLPKNFHAHNQILEELSRRGLVGLACFLLFLCVPLAVFYRYSKHRQKEIRLLSHLGILHSLLIGIYGFSQAFFAHNSGLIFYSMFIVFLYSAIINQLDIKTRKIYS